MEVVVVVTALERSAITLEIEQLGQTEKNSWGGGARLNKNVRFNKGLYVLLLRCPRSGQMAGISKERSLPLFEFLLVFKFVHELGGDLVLGLDKSLGFFRVRIFEPAVGIGDSDTVLSVGYIGAADLRINDLAI